MRRASIVQQTNTRKTTCMHNDKGIVSNYCTCNVHVKRA
jgi:hypothetical protein